MSYMLRVEGVNLGNFVTDTNDLSTIRGGGLLLLDAMKIIEGIISEELPKDVEKAQIDSSTAQSSLEKEIKTLQAEINSKKFNKRETKLKKRALNKKKKALAKTNQGVQVSPDTTKPITTITKGASWGLFKIDTDLEKAKSILKKVQNHLEIEDDNLKYATFVVDLLEYKKGKYQETRDKLQTLNHYQQMQSPSFSFQPPAAAVCSYDKVSPAPGKDLTTPHKNRFQSLSVKHRRNYGKSQKRQSFYHKKTQITDSLQFTNDLDELSNAPAQGILHNKIALIYIDGNNFGNIQKNSKTDTAQRKFDQNTRRGRETLLHNFIESIKDDLNWKNNEAIRLETLLWGGDEIIWVVPAWQGIRTLEFFYQQAKTLIKNNEEELYHAASIIFAHHNAPIHAITELAKNLADDFVKKANKQQNLIAYESLKSFDHIGSGLDKYRKTRWKTLAKTPRGQLLKAENLASIQDLIRHLKQQEFPHRKLYQITQALRNNNQEQYQDYYQKLSDFHSTLNELKTNFAEDEDFAGDKNENNAMWLHMIELWDYVSREQDLTL